MDRRYFFSLRLNEWIEGALIISGGQFSINSFQILGPQIEKADSDRLRFVLGGILSKKKSSSSLELLLLTSLR